MDRAVVDLDDAWVLNDIRGPRLGEESVYEIAVRGELRAKHLDGGYAIDVLVLGQVYLAHAALTDPLKDPVAAEYVLN